MTRLISEYRLIEVACCWDNDWWLEWRVELFLLYKMYRVAEVVEDAFDVEVVFDLLEI